MEGKNVILTKMAENPYFGPILASKENVEDLKRNKTLLFISYKFVKGENFFHYFLFLAETLAFFQLDPTKDKAFPPIDPHYKNRPLL